MDPQSDIHSLGAKQRSQCPVMDECFHGNLDKIKAHIKDQPRHLNRRITPMRESCLAYVIFGYTHLKSPGHVKCVKFLVDEGAPVSGKDAGGNTPLISVIGGWIRAEETGWNGQHEEMAEFLFERGADINMKNRFGESPLFTAAMQASNDSRQCFISNTTLMDCRTARLFGTTHRNTRSLTELAFVAGRQQPLCLKIQLLDVEVVILMRTLIPGAFGGCSTMALIRVTSTMTASFCTTLP